VKSISVNIQSLDLTLELLTIRNVVIIILLGLFLTACSTKYDKNIESSFIVQEELDDTTIRMYASSQRYNTFEDIDIVAEYEYIGMNDEITFKQGDPFFSFIVRDQMKREIYRNISKDEEVETIFERNHVYRWLLTDIVDNLEPGEYYISFWAQTTGVFDNSTSYVTNEFETRPVHITITQ